jgi:predicted transcriptional regulator of viral defense system
MTSQAHTQRDTLLAHLGEHAMARSHELRALGVAATTVSRAVDEGIVDRLGRGLYRLSDCDVDANASLAEVSKRMPKATICLTSALAFHGLTDQMPRTVWIAIGQKDWKPGFDYPKTRIVRFRDTMLSGGIEHHDISGVQVSVYSIAKSLADAFRNPKLVDRSVAVEALKAALRDGKATPAEIAKAAKSYKAWPKMQPYLEALTANG